MEKFKVLTDEQVEKLKIFIAEINKVEGNMISFKDETLYMLGGMYKIIEKKGNGDPVKAAKWRLNLTTTKST